MPPKSEIDQTQHQKGATLSVSQKTHPGMLPQSQALEITAADTPRDGTKRAVIEGFTLSTGGQHGRGETN